MDRVSDEVSVRCNYQTEKRSSIIITIGHRAPRAVFSSSFCALKVQTFKTFHSYFTRMECIMPHCALFHERKE